MRLWEPQSLLNCLEGMTEHRLHRLIASTQRLGIYSLGNLPTKGDPSEAKPGGEDNIRQRR
jgi:hypothetical protein